MHAIAKRLLFCLLLSLFTFLARGQLISGHVYREGTQIAVPQASVYYNNSLTGTITNNNGEFQLISKPGKNALTASCVGYYSAEITEQTPGQPLVIYLKPKVGQLQEVTIGSEGITAEEKLSLFKKEFIGTSAYALSCDILNIADLNLIYRKATKTLTVTSDKPLEIVNKKLGYTITYFLDRFECSPQHTSFSGNLIFKESGNTTREIARNRETAYKGSRMQFIRAVWHNTLQKTHFEIYTRYSKLLNSDSLVTTNTANEKFISLKNGITAKYVANEDMRLTRIAKTDKPCYINEYGFSDTNLKWSGDMGIQRLGDMLPFEYKLPGENYDIVEPRSVPATTKTIAETKPEETVTTIPFFYEKAYLHTDRDVYTQGEDIWFKAYLVDAQNSKPIGYSRNLYVELINPALKILTMHLIRMENGLGNGDFKLADTLSSGTYRIRAYTNWMRNFGDSFIFEKNITIVNTSGKPASVATVKKAIKRLKLKQAVVSKQDTLPTGPLVRFFVEGGSLINDVSSVVAVKAEDEFGKGIAVQGQIVASSARVVAKFSCDSLGFGTFTLQPDETQEYHAEVTIKGQPYNFKLRSAKNKGFTLGANAVSPFIVAEINCNRHELSESTGSSLVIVGRHGNKVIYKESFRVQTKNILVQIPDVNFPEGIACITLYDEHAKPLSERLVYVHHANSTTLSVGTDSASYHPKQKVTVKIKLSDSTRTNLSLAAIDEGMAPVSPENIVSYLELRSEIKGYIEHPERYFDAANPNRLKQLDLLLLTQGWRNFVWKDIEETRFTQQYDVEQAITLTGRVRNVWTDKALPKMNITMFAPKAIGDKLFTTQSDSTGKFRIDGAVFYGYQYLNFNSRRSDGIDMYGRSKGKTGGWMIVDSLNQNRPEVKPPITLPADTVPISTNAFTAREQLKQKFSFSGINALQTVQIKGITTELPPEIYPITATEQKEYGSVGQYVASLIPNSHWVMPDDEPPVLYTGYFTSMFLVSVRGAYSDRSPVTVGREPKPIDDEYWGLPMNKALKVTIFGYQTALGKIYSVQVLMRPGALKVHDNFDNTMADVVGYTKARTFYKPRYEVPNNKPDYRTTIHWEPYITTDAHGEATLSYYNADPKTKVRIIVQGVTDKGVPVAATAGYEVK